MHMQKLMNCLNFQYLAIEKKNENFKLKKFNLKKMNNQYKDLVKEEYVIEIINNVSDILNKKFENNQDKIVFAPILTGAAFLSVHISEKLKFKHMFVPIFYTSYDGQVKNESSNVFIKNESLFKDANVILFDELYDTGDTFENISKYLSEIGVNSLTSCCFFLKYKKNYDYPLPDIIGLVTPDFWLVGCGLDDNEYNRNIKKLVAMPKTFKNLKIQIEDEFFNSNKTMIFIQENDSLFERKMKYFTIIIQNENGLLINLDYINS